MLAENESVLAPGQRLDRYELLTPIASGGMATVWLARLIGKRGFEKLVAIKTIRTEFSDDTRFEEMFLDEARIASAIQHPNVAQIIDLGEEQGVLYIVMEWVDGESLAKLRKAAQKRGVQFPLGVALRILADACAGLHAAHELRDDKGELLGIVHRDISPHNILVSSTGVVKVIDFGIAKAKNRMAKETGTGVVKGKVAYMAREQAMGGELDRRVDVWAVGVCLYELLTGELPFDGDNQLEIFQNIVALAPRPRIEGATPEVVDEILDKALARLPEERYRSAAAMERALEDAITTLELDGSTEAVQDFVRENLGERFAKRKELVNKAIESAAKRAATPRPPVVDEFAPPPSFEEAPTVAAAKAHRPSEPKTPTTDVPVTERTNAHAPATVRSGGEKEPEKPAPKSSVLPLLLVAAAAVGGVMLWKSNNTPEATPSAPPAVTSVAPVASSVAPIASSVATIAPPAPMPSVSAAPSTSTSTSTSTSVSASASVPHVQPNYGQKLPQLPTPPPTATATAAPTPSPVASTPPPLPEATTAKPPDDNPYDNE